jgi:branched-chain amino acid aminotransferase
MATFPSFKASDVKIERCKESCAKPKPDPNNLVFGAHFSDHMFEVDWREDRGWGEAKICPVHDLQLHPAAKVFHYAIELFEGTKAYRGHDGKIRLFRPDMNAKRMLSSAERATLPLFDEAELVGCIKKLVAVDREWVPHSTSSTLYIRPTLIGTEESLGVARSKSALLFVLTGPVGPYYPTGFKPVSLLADPKFVRSWAGGAGAYKMGSNYAPTIAIQMEAAKRNCQQVLWLNGDDHEVTEVGTMNFLMYWINEQGEKELITPTLDTGLILPGVTRQSLLDLGRKWGDFKVTERSLYMWEIVKALKENRLKELFGAGTACVVCPIESILYDGKKLEIPTMKEGAPVTMRFYKELTDIQFGKIEHPWAVVVE